MRLLALSPLLIQQGQEHQRRGAAVRIPPSSPRGAADCPIDLSKLDLRVAVLSVGDRRDGSHLKHSLQTVLPPANACNGA